ncbi:MAG: protein kinase domain-containing protein [Planctomycetota bacterium]|jgi:tetratricopeptide (TPR) repeat protein/predicted Ser/Thr protein kinase
MSTLQDVFARVLECAPKERSACLEELCGDDDALKGRVRSLMDAHERLGGFLAEPETASVAGAGGEARTRLSIGRYTVRREIAAGGMGVVYEAEQDHPHRTVALKVLRLGTASVAMTRRFRHEVEILGRLRHPNIAQVYDAGTFDEGEGGQPWFAMELIRGRPLIEYAESRKLSSRQRLGLFVKVCEAVQYAQQRGIIHRDLKHDNILVDEHHEPKILDFGVARLTDSDIQVTTLRTDLGQLIGTVPYMSPEQAAGDQQELDTRSDVYALGVVLYELLCGRLPYDLKDKSIPQALRVIGETDPTPLSSISRVFRGDLDTIVAKALEKERDRRYQSATEVAADIRHYLTDEPIVARPASTFYQLKKFTQRNRVLVSGVAATFLVLVLGLITTLWQAVHARREAENALIIKAFLGQTIGAADFVEAGRRLTAEEVLDRAVAQIPSQLGGRAEIEAEVRHLLGLGYASMSAMDKALTQLRAAHEIRRDILGPEHHATMETAHSMGETLHAHGRWAEAEEVLGEVVQARRRALGEDHPDTLWSMSQHARALNLVIRAQEAEPIARRALEGLEHELGEGNERTIRTRYVYATTLSRNGRVDDGITAMRYNLDICRRSLGEEHRLTLEMKRELGAIMWWLSKGDREEAESLLRSSLEANRRLFGDDDLNTWYWTQTLGNFLFLSGDVAEAEPLLRKGLEGLRRVLGDRNVRTALAMQHLSKLEASQGRLAEAETLMRRCTEIRRDLFPADYPDTYGGMSHLGWLQHKQGKCDDAQVTLREAHRGLRDCLGPQNSATLLTTLLLGHCLRNSGLVEEADVHLQASRGAFEEVLGANHFTGMLRSLVRDFGDGAIREAELMLHACYEELKKAYGDRDQRTEAARSVLAELLDATSAPE